MQAPPLLIDREASAFMRVLIRVVLKKALVQKPWPPLTICSATWRYYCQGQYAANAPNHPSCIVLLVKQHMHLLHVSKELVTVPVTVLQGVQEWP